MEVKSHARSGEPREVEVLVVGGGPAGLTTALSLADRGIDTLVVERRDFSQHFPRAHLLNVRTMEIFHDLGVAEEVYELAPPEGRWHKVAWYTSLAGPTPLHGRKIGELQAWGGGSDAARYAEASPRPFANLPQLLLDEILARHAAERLPGRVLAQHELVDLTQDDAGVTARVLNRENGQTFSIRARYLVAADGGRASTPLLGVTLHGPRALVEVVDLFITCDLTDYADEEALLTYFIGPGGRASVPGNILSLLPGQTARDSQQWRIGMKFPIGDPVLEDRDATIALLREQVGLPPDHPMQIHGMSRWQYEGVVAERFRYDSVFLVGDAAHRHPPTGGLGLNTAVQDAANLSWKLAAVLRGQGGEHLLDTYESERLPVAVFNVEHALRNAGRHGPIRAAMGLTDSMSAEEGWREVAVWASETAEGERRRAAVDAAVTANADDYSQLNVEAGFSYEIGAVLPDGTEPPPSHDSVTEFVATARPGHHIPHVWLDGERISSVDLVAAEGLTLFAAPSRADAWRAAAEQANATTGCPIAVVEASPDLADLCEISDGGAMLIRPDKHVAWRSPDDSLTGDSPTDLGRVVHRLLWQPLEGKRTSTTSLQSLFDAGEALRDGSNGGPTRLFDWTPA